MARFANAVRYYHGCTQLAWEEMQGSGFHISFDPGRRDLKRWLCGFGLYLFVDNRLLAHSFALQKSDWARDNPRTKENAAATAPILLEAQVRLDPGEHKILDLTTPEGMQDLYLAHRRFKHQLRGSPDQDYSPLPPITNDYTATVSFFSALPGYFPTTEEVKTFARRIQSTPADDHEELYEDIANMALRIYKSGRGDRRHREFSFDCMVITRMVAEQNISAVVAAIQEGHSFHRGFYKHKFKTKDTKGFRGLRMRDRIELCLTRVDALRHLEPVEFDPAAEFDPRFARYFLGLDEWQN